MIVKTKDPNEVLDYLFRWTKELERIDDTISSFEIIAETGITIDSSSNTDTEVTVWISGGTIAERYLVTCRIVTAGGRTYDKSFYLHIAQQ